MIASCTSGPDNSKAISDAIYKNDTPLIIAAKAGKIRAVKFLLDNGADVNKRNRYGKSVIYYPY
jgi:ankyrin repeat protein